MSFGTKKPKFKLDLIINELSNIPHVRGNCYLELQIRDNKRVKSLPSFRTLSMKNTSKPDGTETPRSDSSTSLISEGSTSLGSGGNISVTTSAQKIHNFKCAFNFHVSCNVKFGVKRRENLIADKFLMVKVFYVGEKHKDFGLHHSSNRFELGKLEINLAEYLNFDEPVTSKYLLKDLKVNSILNVTIFLSELPENFEFHTQLQVSDALNHERAKSVNAAHSTVNQYNVPQFERRNIFGGLNDVIGSENKSRLSSDSARQDSLEKSPTPEGRSKSNDKQVLKSKYNQPVLIDPIVNDLHKKVLESTWDPKLHLLLDYSPEVCVKSVFDDNIDELKQKLKEELANDDDEDDEIRCIHGLVNETNYREDLRSWGVKNVN